jgi:hypothetical protein
MITLEARVSRGYFRERSVALSLFVIHTNYLGRPGQVSSQAPGGSLSFGGRPQACPRDAPQAGASRLDPPLALQPRNNRSR